MLKATIKKNTRDRAKESFRLIQDDREIVKRTTIGMEDGCSVIVDSMRMSRHDTMQESGLLAASALSYETSRESSACVQCNNNNRNHFQLRL